MKGFIEGKGSNNWAVGPDRSETGAVMLAGDMHLHCGSLQSGTKLI